MLITFHSKVVAEILMLEMHALPLLLAAGKSCGDKVPERGIFTVEQLAPAIAGLERAIQEAGPAPREDPDEERDSDEPSLHPMARPVGFAQRAFPLLDMMRRSQAGGAEVVWEASRGW